MKALIFDVVIEPDQNLDDGTKGYHAYCPALKGCRTWGYTYEETRVKIKEVIELCLESLKEQGEPIPAEITEQEIESDSIPINVKVPIPVKVCR